MNNELTIDSFAGGNREGKHRRGGVRVKTDEQITAARRRLLEAAAEFGKRLGLPFASHTITGRDLHCMALGALAMADDVLQLDRPDNLSRMISALEKANDDAAKDEAGRISD